MGLQTMGKGRVRVKGAKGKRWRKGQSGSSNPSETRHRQAAKGRFGDHLSRGRVPTSGPPLTADTLATHDASQEEGFALDRYSIGGEAEESSQTWLCCNRTNYITFQTSVCCSAEMETWSCGRRGRKVLTACTPALVQRPAQPTH